MVVIAVESGVGEPRVGGVVVVVGGGGGGGDDDVGWSFYDALGVYGLARGGWAAWAVGVGEQVVDAGRAAAAAGAVVEMGVAVVVHGYGGVG